MKNNNRGDILIVDDEEDILNLLEAFLEEEWNITVTRSPEDALDLIKTNDFFLVITDIAMPVMDGYELITEMLECGYQNGIAVMTGFGYNPKHTLVKINKKKKYPLFFKPFNFEDSQIKDSITQMYNEFIQRQNQDIF